MSQINRNDNNILKNHTVCNCTVNFSCKWFFCLNMYCKNIVYIYWKFKSINHNVKVEGRYEVNILLIKYVKTKLYTYFAIKRGGQNICFTPPFLQKEGHCSNDCPPLGTHPCYLSIFVYWQLNPHSIQLHITFFTWI